MGADDGNRGSDHAGAFDVLVPARFGSTRLPGKALADLGGTPMVVRVARRAARAGARRVVVCTDDARIVAACGAAGVESVLTSAAHATGTDRLAEACSILGLPGDAIVVNVQGDEPLMPPAIIESVAALLRARTDCEIATAAHPLRDAAEFFNPNVVKVVVDHRDRALLFSRAPIPWARDAFAGGGRPAALPPELPAWRHVGLYAYRVRFLLQYPRLPQVPIERLESLEQLRALWHGHGIVVARLREPLPPGVDTAEDLEAVRALIAAGAAA
ncbi:MAG TPA: 3-deoxy-manno-octulosonate cytidylyltransferase [Burkholderiaceae bacterium]|nr:3-deoxy-manno-octulosonate cytidylyltransferase [Burkholderiaceae bacterium]